MWVQSQFQPADCVAKQTLTGRPVCVSQLTQVFAKARLLEAPERRRHIRLVVGVDEDGAGLQTLAHVHCLIDVTGEHTRRQTVLGVVGPP